MGWPELAFLYERERDSEFCGFTKNPAKEDSSMMPIGPLMIEHRLIERMIRLMKVELEDIKRAYKVDTKFMDTAIDFLRMYADRCHHGKEEDILFLELMKKKISPEHGKILEELMDEHVWSRETVKKLVDANESYWKGNRESIAEIIKLLHDLVSFYPVHIAKEDKKFFLPIMGYFSDQEQEAMLRESWEFDRKLIHEKYAKVVAMFEKK